MTCLDGPDLFHDGQEVGLAGAATGAWAECDGGGGGADAQGAKATGAAIVRADGIRGLYRGFGTTIFGLIPARIVSAPTLAADAAEATAAA